MTSSSTPAQHEATAGFYEFREWKQCQVSVIRTGFQLLSGSVEGVWHVLRVALVHTSGRVAEGKDGHSI